MRWCERALPSEEGALRRCETPTRGTVTRGWFRAGARRGLQNRLRPDIVGLGGFDSHALPPLLALAAALFCQTSAAAQRPDTLPPRVVRVVSLDSLQPPLSPRRAFLYSFAVPGYGQSVLGRHKAAVAFLVVEGISIAMIRESGAEVHEARRMAMNDSTAPNVRSWVDPNTGGVLTVPDTSARPFTDQEVHSRRAHIEDWIALLVANHLFAGADAFVASNLWDVSARLSVKAVPRGVAVAATIEW